jgi:hypothetical protein
MQFTIGWGHSRTKCLQWKTVHHLLPLCFFPFLTQRPQRLSPRSVRTPARKGFIASRWRKDPYTCARRQYTYLKGCHRKQDGKRTIREKDLMDLDVVNNIKRLLLVSVWFVVFLFPDWVPFNKGFLAQLTESQETLPLNAPLRQQQRSKRLRVLDTNWTNFLLLVPVPSVMSYSLCLSFIFHVWQTYFHTQRDERGCINAGFVKFLMLTGWKWYSRRLPWCMFSNFREIRLMPNPMYSLTGHELYFFLQILYTESCARYFQV